MATTELTGTATCDGEHEDEAVFIVEVKDDKCRLEAKVGERTVEIAVSRDPMFWFVNRVGATKPYGWVPSITDE